MSETASIEKETKDDSQSGILPDEWLREESIKAADGIIATLASGDPEEVAAAREHIIYLKQFRWQFYSGGGRALPGEGTKVRILSHSHGEWCQRIDEDYAKNNMAQIVIKMCPDMSRFELVHRLRELTNTLDNMCGYKFPPRRWWLWAYRRAV